MILEKWYKLIKTDICKYIESMPKYCKLIIIAIGDSINY